MTNRDLTREYSQRLGVITAAQLQAALDRFDLGQLIDARPAPGGLFGQNVLIVSTKGGFVLRGAPHTDWQFQAERFFARIIHDRSTVTSAWPFEVERSTEIFGWSFAMMPLLPGEHLSDPDVRRGMSDADRLGIARAMGDHLGRLQAVMWDTPGTYDATGDAIKPLFEPYAAWFAAKVRALLAQCRASAPAAMADADIEWVEQVIAAAEGALAEPFVPSIVHTDYTEGNVVAERAGGGWRISGVFDLAECYAGDGEYDLARIGAHYAAQSPEAATAFVEAYAAHRPLRDGFYERLALYILYDRLIFWEYGWRNHIWFTPEHGSFRSWAQPVVERRLI